MIYINVDSKKGKLDIECTGGTGELIAELAGASMAILKAIHIETKDKKDFSLAEKVMYYAEKLSLAALDMKEEEREADGRK